MSYPALPNPSAGRSSVLRAADARTLRDGVIAGLTIALALSALYAVYFDQGAMLAPLLGDLSWSANYVHEFFHDGRHLFGVPCH